MADWKIRIGLRECKTFYDQTEEEQMLPFLPRKGDVFWMSVDCQDRLEKRVLKCRKQHCDCGDGCPFISDGEPDLNNQVIVHEVYFNVPCHIVKIILRDDSNILWDQHE